MGDFIFDTVSILDTVPNIRLNTKGENDMDEKEVMLRHYNQLVGYKVAEVIVEDSLYLGENPIIAFIMKKSGKDDLLVTLLSDAEGNDTGFMEISKWEENQ